MTSVRRGPVSFVERLSAVAVLLSCISVFKDIMLSVFVIDLGEGRRIMISFVLF